MRTGVGFAVLALALVGASAPDVGWQKYEDAMKISASTGKAVCLVFQNDKVDPKAGGG